MAPDNDTPTIGARVIPFTMPTLDLLEDETEPTMDDLAFIARLFMERAIAEIDWTKYAKVAAFLLDEGDARTVVKLMQNAKVEVVVGE